MQGRRAVEVHWKAELNNSVLRRVLNVPILVASRVDELRLFQIVGAAKQKLRLAAADFEKELGEDVVLLISDYVKVCSVQQTVEVGRLFESLHVECDESDLEYYPLLDRKPV